MTDFESLTLLRSDIADGPGMVHSEWEAGRPARLAHQDATELGAGVGQGPENCLIWENTVCRVFRSTRFSPSYVLQSGRRALTGEQS